jgi:hypothetical protein
LSLSWVRLNWSTPILYKIHFNTPSTPFSSMWCIFFRFDNENPVQIYSWRATSLTHPILLDSVLPNNIWQACRRADVSYYRNTHSCSLSELYRSVPIHVLISFTTAPSPPSTRCCVMFCGLLVGYSHASKIEYHLAGLWGPM